MTKSMGWCREDITNGQIDFMNDTPLFSKVAVAFNAAKMSQEQSDAIIEKINALTTEINDAVKQSLREPVVRHPNIKKI